MNRDKLLLIATHAVNILLKDPKRVADYALNGNVDKLLTRELLHEVLVNNRFYLSIPANDWETIDAIMSDDFFRKTFKTLVLNNIKNFKLY